MKKLNLDFSSREARQAFYRSSSWLRLRDAKLYAKPICEICITKGIVTPAQDVHHKIDIKDQPNLRLTYSNLQSLCYDCHNRITVTNQFNSEKNLQPANKVHSIEILQIKK